MEMNKTEMRYEEACQMQKAASTLKLRAARELFLELGDYEDSVKRIAECDRLLEFAKGSHVNFGTWNGSPLSWLVLDEKGCNRMLITDKAVTFMPFNKDRNDTPWSHSTLRHWLNKDFLEQTFTLKERMGLLVTMLDNHADPRWGIENGQDTKDKCFIFNWQELEHYMPTDEERANGEWWWLRGHGFGDLCIQAIYTDGSLYHIGVNKNSAEIGVRPVIWTRL